MRMYAQLDVDWPENPKRIRAGLEASAVHALCLCLAKRSAKDGWIARDTVALYGATDELIGRLVDLALLDAEGEWVRPHDWLEVNLSSQRIRAEKADKARLANHARWHDGPFDACEKCKEKARSSEADPNGVHADPPASLHRSEPEAEQQQQPQANDAEARRLLFEEAANIIGQRAADRPSTANPEAMRRSVAAAVKKDRYEDAYRAISENPTITADELAELLEPTKPATVHPLEPMAQAQDRLQRRRERVANGEACFVCEDVGFTLDDDGLARECVCKRSEQGA